MYEVHYNGRMSYVRNYLYCCIQWEGLLWRWARSVSDT